MPEQYTFQLQENAAQIYEEQKVPAMFRPLAEAILRHVAVPEGARVIDIACGIGIVWRLLSHKAGEALRDYRTDDGIAIPQHTHLIRAIA